MPRLLRYLPIFLLLLLLVGLAITRFTGGQKETDSADNTPTQAGVLKTDIAGVYLLIGGSNMAGMADLPEDDIGAIERVELLNDKNEWEPARSPLNRYSTIDESAVDRKLGPGYSFARTLQAADEEVVIKLIVNAGDDAEIQEWLGKSNLYWGIRGRARRAPGDEKVMGVVWMPSSKDLINTESYSGKLGNLVASLRSDLNEENLPFIVAGCVNAPDINTELKKFAEKVPYTGVVSMDGLSLADDVHLDTRSQLQLGERLANEMMKVRASLPEPLKPPSDLAFVDPHVHAMAVTAQGLRSVALWMQDRNVEQCIVSPLNHKGSRAWTEEEREQMLENYKPYAGSIHRMCIIDAGELETLDQAIEVLEREKADGAVGFGEHYGRDLMFDDPKNLMLYEACEKVGLPVMFHIDQNKNMVTPGMPEVDRVLKKYPNCNLVAHAYWWRQYGNGACDRQLQEHPNLYADMSGRVVVSILSRDPEGAREFLIRNQDKILWATDEGWWSFGNRDKQMNQHYTFLEGLDLPDEVRRKIYRENAIKVYGLRGGE